LLGTQNDHQAKEQKTKVEDEDEEHMEGKVETTENSDTWPVISVESLLAASTSPGFQGSAHTSQEHFAAPFAC